MKLSLPPKIGGKKLLVWVPVISLCKIFIPSYTCDAETGRSRPPLIAGIIHSAYYKCTILTFFQSELLRK